MAAVAYPMSDPCGGGGQVRPPRLGWSLRPARLWDVPPPKGSRPVGAGCRRLGGGDRRPAGVGGIRWWALTATRSSGAGTDAAAGAAQAGAGPASQAGSHVYIVQPGDTIWSIVQGSGHRGDLRPLVDRIALQLDGRPLQPGQHLLIP